MVKASSSRSIPTSVAQATDFTLHKATTSNGNPDLNSDRQAGPSRTTVLTFIVSIITATGITWLLVDFSLKNLVVLFLSMLLGGSLYFLWRARE